MTATNIKQGYEQAIQLIEVGQKYTLFGFGEFGFPNVSHTVIEDVYINSYAQYENALYIIHRPKRKRASYKRMVLPYQELYIYKGWIDIDTNKVWNTEERNGFTVRSSSYTSFDKRNISDIIAQVEQKPIVIHNEDYYVNVDELEFVYRVVTMEGAQDFTFPQLEARYEITGYKKDHVGRIELQNQPILKDLCGAMFDGYEDGKAVIRYETQEAYNILPV